MPKLKSLADLQTLRQQLQKDIKVRTDTATTIRVGMGTCGIAAGAREVMHAILDAWHPTGPSRYVPARLIQTAI